MLDITDSGELNGLTLSQQVCVGPVSLIEMDFSVPTMENWQTQYQRITDTIDLLL